jgi:hypothetical protein
MTKKWLKKLFEKLNRSDGVSIMAIVVLMLVMTVMGGVFTRIMGEWKVSAPMAINSTRALQLANTAAAFAFQEASFKFYGGSFNYGTRGTPYTVYNDGNGGTADYWIERPGASYTNDDDTTGDDDDAVDDDGDDSNMADDKDGDSVSDLHTIIATGKVAIGGTTVAKRQIKIFAHIYPKTTSPIAPGVHTDGVIIGTGSNVGNAFGITRPSTSGLIQYESPGPDNILNPPYTVADEAGLVYRTAPVLDSDFFRALAQQQGHYHSGNLTIGGGNDNYPNGNFMFDIPNSIPNFTYVEGDLNILANRTTWGVYYVKGDTDLGGANSNIQGLLICEGNIDINGTAFVTGGIIHYGATITGNGDPAAITINDAMFANLNASIPEIKNVVWQDAVSAQ